MSTDSSRSATAPNTQMARNTTDTPMGRRTMCSMRRFISPARSWSWRFGDPHRCTVAQAVVAQNNHAGAGAQRIHRGPIAGYALHADRRPLRLVVDHHEDADLFLTVGADLFDDAAARNHHRVVELAEIEAHFAVHAGSQERCFVREDALDGDRAIDARDFGG